MGQVAPTKSEERKSPGNPIGPSIFSVLKRLGSQKWELPSNTRTEPVGQPKKKKKKFFSHRRHE